MRLLLLFFHLSGYGKTRCIHKIPVKSSLWHRYHNNHRMLKKAIQQGHSE